MTLGEPYIPQEPEWLIRAQAGLPPIQKTSELPHIIPPIPEGDTKDLKVWREYWTQHDAAIRQDEREKVLDDEHYRNILSLCDNLLVHLEDNDISYLQIKKTVVHVKKELAELRTIKQEQP